MASERFTDLFEIPTTFGYPSPCGNLGAVTTDYTNSCRARDLFVNQILHLYTTYDMSLDNSNINNAVNAEKQLGSFTLDYNGSILQVSFLMH